MSARSILPIIRPVIALGSRDFLQDVRSGLEAHAVPEAVAARDTSAIFDWLVRLIPLQGVSDQAAASFSARRSSVRWSDIEAALAGQPGCRRLRSYWDFHDCRYRKSEGSCSQPDLLAQCLVPRLPMRNGRLSQAAVSLFLFMRDVAGGNLVGWIDDRLALAQRLGRRSPRELANAIIRPLANVHGVGDKVLSMALADLLLAGDPGRPLWVETGASMVAVDSLVHNFFVRTGALQATGRPHPYGPRCHEPRGCLGLIEEVAALIDARAFNAAYPPYFPRFIQHAAWRFCGEGGWAICNGRRIDDRRACEFACCPVIACRRRPLSPQSG